MNYSLFPLLCAVLLCFQCHHSVKKDSHGVKVGNPKLQIRIRPVSVTFSPQGEPTLKVDENGEADVEVDIVNLSSATPVQYFPSHIQLFALARKKGLEKRNLEKWPPSPEYYVRWQPLGEAYGQGLNFYNVMKFGSPESWPSEIREVLCVVISKDEFNGRKEHLWGLNDYPYDEVIALYIPDEEDAALRKRKDLKCEMISQVIISSSLPLLRCDVTAIKQQKN